MRARPVTSIPNAGSGRAATSERHGICLAATCRCFVASAVMLASVAVLSGSGLAQQELPCAGRETGPQHRLIAAVLVGRGLAQQELPWKSNEAREVQPPTPRLSSPREMLGLFRIDDSQLRQLIDGRPFGSDEEETLVKILYRMPQFGLERIEAWCQKSPVWSELAAEPEEHRLGFYRLDGHVTALETTTIPDEAAERLEFDRYYRVHMDVPGTDHPVQVLTRHLPSAWLKQADRREGELSERAGCCGLLLKAGAAKDGLAELVFAAERIAWFPEHVRPDAGVTPSIVLLGDLGMDVGLFDTIRETNRKGLVPEDSEAFYQMLAAVRGTTVRELAGYSTGGFDSEPMLTRPRTQQGRLVTIQGTARRVQRILIGDRATQQRFGMDHYFQVDVFVPLGDEEVRLDSGEDGEEAAVFRNAFPVTVCTTALPSGLPVSDEVSEQIRVTGFYFKLWAYRTEYVSSFDPKQRQIGPLLIAKAPTIVPPRPKSESFWGWIGGGAFLAILAAIMLTAWIYRRGDRRFYEQVLRRQITGESDPKHSR